MSLLKAVGRHPRSSPKLVRSMVRAGASPATQGLEEKADGNELLIDIESNLTIPKAVRRHWNSVHKLQEPFTPKKFENAEGALSKLTLNGIVYGKWSKEALLTSFPSTSELRGSEIHKASLFAFLLASSNAAGFEGVADTDSTSSSAEQEDTKTASSSSSINNEELLRQGREFLFARALGLVELAPDGVSFDNPSLLAALINNLELHPLPARLSSAIRRRRGPITSSRSRRPS